MLSKESKDKKTPQLGSQHELEHLEFLALPQDRSYLTLQFVTSPKILIDKKYLLSNIRAQQKMLPFPTDN